jgi:hypothetical protein
MFEAAQRVADAVLYEGYVLYPYRASAKKNQMRFQFGVVVPRGFAQAGETERDHVQTQCLLEPAREKTTVSVRLRFLQIQLKQVERCVPGGYEPVAELRTAGETHITFDEAVEHSWDIRASLDELVAGRREVIEVTGGEEVESFEGGRVARRRLGLVGELDVRAEDLPGPYGVKRLTVRLGNRAVLDDPHSPRDEVLRRSFVATHVLLAADGGRFLSLLDPPEWAQGFVQTCDNVGLFPVLIGERGGDDAMLASPIILYDHPQVAPESPGDMFDATEIDEMLALRTLALTDEEKAEARATDARAAAVIDRVDSLPPEVLERLHGAVRSLRDVGAGRGAAERPPWWDPDADASVSPETDEVIVQGVALRRGSLVRLRPGLKRADAQDMFLSGRLGRVEAVFFDVDQGSHLAVTLEDDPAAELNRWHGRFLYFSPDEVEPVTEQPPTKKAKQR